MTFVNEQDKEFIKNKVGKIIYKEVSDSLKVGLGLAESIRNSFPILMQFIVSWQENRCKDCWYRNYCDKDPSNDSKSSYTSTKER